MHQLIQHIPKGLADKIAKEHDYLIIDMNVEEQLFMLGVTAENIPILNFAPYSPVTIDIKREKGQPTDRVTLRDGGDFHDSFTVEVRGQSLWLKSDDEKAGDLTDRYGREIFGLTDDNLQELRTFYIKPSLLNYIKENLNNG